MPKLLDPSLVDKAMSFFGSETYRTPSREDEGYIDNFNRFMGYSRKVLQDILSEHLQDTEPIIPQEIAEFIIDAHGQTTTNELGLLTGSSGGPLAEQGIVRAREFLNPDVMPQIIISSDSSRAIHHTVEKYFPEEAKGQRLQQLLAQTPSSLDQNYGLIEPGVQLGWVKYALDLGIVPTPLLRAQFYGTMELFPEKEDEKVLQKEEEKLKKKNLSKAEIDARLNQLRQALTEKREHCYQLQRTRFGQLEVNEVRVQQALDYIRYSLERRSDPKYSMTAEDGRQLTEQRVDLDKRIDFVMNMLAPEGELFHLTRGRRIQIVSHSGTNDAVFEYLRRYEDPSGIHIIKRKKPSPRGESILVTVDAPNKRIAAFRYLNDPAPLEDTVQMTGNEITAFRQASPDEKIRSGNGIMPTEFYVLKKSDRDNRDEKAALRLEEVLADESPYLVLASCGLGKTMFSLDLASRLMPEGDLNHDGNYVPILIRLREVKSRLDQERKTNKRTDYDILKGILTSEISSLSPETVATYKKQGKRLIFILDGFDELDPSLKDDVTFSRLMQDISQIGKVVVTSRYEHFSQYANGNSNLGYARTINIDPDAIVRHLDSYLASRITDERERKKLGEFIQKQSPDIKNNWLMVYFITDIYRREPESIDLEGEVTQTQVMKKGIEWYVWDHAYRRDPGLFSPIVRNPDDMDESYEARNRQHLLDRKNMYIKEVMPTLRKIFTYMLVNDKQVITADEAQMVIDGKWDLQWENQQRTGKR